MRRIILSFLTMGICMCSQTFAEGSLFGRFHLAFSGGYFRSGETSLRTLDSGGMIYGGKVGIPLSANIDIRSEVSHFSLSNGVVFAHYTFLDTNILYHFETSGSVKPAAFIGLTLKRLKWEHDINAPFPEGDTNLDFGFNAGLETEFLIFPRGFLNVGSNYRYIDGSNEIFAKANLTLWLGQSAFLPLSIDYEIKNGNLIFMLQLGFSF